jgi:outer membrane protein assembly factor BamB
VQGEHLYVVTNVGELHAFDTDDGERAWSYDLGEETTPLAWSSDGALLVGTASGDVLKLTTDRETRWRTRVPADDGDGLWLAPVPDGAGGCSIVTARGEVVALDATGAMRWRAAPDSPVVSPLLVSDSGGERMGKPGSEKGMVYGTTHEGDLLALAAAGGAERWRYATGSRLQAPPVRGPDGTLYLGTGDGRLLAISPEGTLLWQAHLGGAVEATPIVAPDGTLYVATAGGRLYAFAPLFPRQ